MSIGSLIAGRLGSLPDERWLYTWSYHALNPIAGIARMPVMAIFWAWLCGAFLMLLLVILRSKILALSAFVLIFTAMFAGPSNYWIYWLVWAVILGLGVVVTAKFGFLSIITALLVWAFLYLFPVTLDLTVWYSDASNAALAACGGIAIWGSTTALTGRSLFLPAKA